MGRMNPYPSKLRGRDPAAWTQESRPIGPGVMGGHGRTIIDGVASKSQCQPKGTRQGPALQTSTSVPWVQPRKENPANAAARCLKESPHLGWERRRAEVVLPEGKAW